jgi:hypothetical protein
MEEANFSPPAVLRLHCVIRRKKICFPLVGREVRSASKSYTEMLSGSWKWSPSCVGNHITTSAVNMDQKSIPIMVLMPNSKRISNAAIMRVPSICEIFHYCVDDMPTKVSAAANKLFQTSNQVKIWLWIKIYSSVKCLGLRKFTYCGMIKSRRMR